MVLHARTGIADNPCVGLIAEMLLDLVGRLIGLKFQLDDSSVWSYLLGIQLMVLVAILCIFGLGALTHT